jgi:beta-glucosidase
VVDVNNNPDNPVINIRAFGETSELVADLTTAFIQGTQTYPLLNCAKHFPGHGDTAQDSHTDLPQLTHDRDRLNQTELPPFRAAIAAGVDSVMTAHLLIPAWDERLPATLSPNILTGELRQNLEFEGIIVTDALIMGGVARHYSQAEIAIKAVQAGADILLMPEDPETTINAIYNAVQKGEIPEQRIAESLARIWQAKQKTTTMGDRTPLLDRLTQNLASSEAQTVTAQILTDSLATGGSLPVPRSNDGRNLIIVDDLLNCPCDRTSPAVTYPQAYGYRLQLGDSDYLQSLEPKESPTLLQIFIRGNPFRGRAGLSEQTQEDYRRWLASGNIRGLAIYGSPYVRDWFVQQLKALSLDLPWAHSYGQIPTAQRSICDRLCPSLSAIKSDRFEN